MAVAVMVSAMDDECNGELDSSYKSVQPHHHSGSFPIGVRKNQDLGSSFNNNAMLCALRLLIRTEQPVLPTLFGAKSSCGCCGCYGMLWAMNAQYLLTSGLR